MTRKDDTHLRILSVCHYVMAAFNVLVGCYLAAVTVWISSVFIFLFGDANNVLPEPSRENRGMWMLVLGFAAATLLCWALAVGHLLTGGFLRRHRHHTFCKIMAHMSCLLGGILGIVLGVFTL